jgi:hypothetical protein
MLKTGALVREAAGGLRRLSGSAAWAICKERGQKAGIQAPAPHDLRRTWVGDLLEFADLATVQRMPAMPRWRPRPDTTGGIMQCSARPRRSCTCPTFPPRSEISLVYDGT